MEMAVEDLESDICAKTVAHEHDMVKGLTLASRRAWDGVGGEEVFERVLDFGLDIVGLVGGGVEGW